MTDLNVIAEGQPTAFLAFWLSRFFLPYGKEVIRPETFVMVALMASGYIYHGLGKAVNHPDHPGKANAIFPRYYLIGWLADKLSLTHARAVFRDGRYPSLRTSSYREDSHNVQDVIDMGLPDKDFKLFLSIRSSVLPEIFGIVQTTAKIGELLDVDRVKVLSDQDFTCSSNIAHIKRQLNNLSSETLKLKDKEQEILREEEERIQSKLKSSLYSKKREVKKVDLIEVGFSKLQDLQKEKDCLENLIGLVISFNNV
ncbi:hypothetical protein Cgig2_001644 [Carnegiea gigantea]|uniref:Aminotransferase-like plant mobile domain-containing protein n=1 Tax=Carnegiea gigantea TaxID=171969 RepID=A0A9Q1GTP7_9CARY|nr:hypothetical protein Cgig2_034015 [Carnegiea gigantea]KAJ8429648.1 hypothetical protein Cgig2_001644 [Carnegiea gigantea]